MRHDHINNRPMSFELKYTFLVAVLLLSMFSATCDNNDPVNPPIFDPLVPTIDGFIAKRGDTRLTENVVYSGEDIKFEVMATSHAFPQSCGLSEDAIVADNLYFSYEAFPPDGVQAPAGEFSSKSPGENEATWRVPHVDGLDNGEGLVYEVMVTVLDECLEKTNTGFLVLRVFADEGPPAITSRLVQSDVNSGNPVEEETDRNGYYEVEPADECRISIEASSRTMPSICANKGIQDGDELVYSWSSTDVAINLALEQFPPLATDAEFDVSSGISPGETFEVSCLVTDQCSGEQTNVVFDFIVVAHPDILSLTGTSNGINMAYDVYFDNYPVLPGDEIVLRALAEVKHPGLCSMKGINPPLEWSWLETSGSTPKLTPDYDPLPVPNDDSSIEFVIPAAKNGTEYTIDCTITDRCNGLTDNESMDLLVVVPPVGSIGWIEKNGTKINPSVDSGRYEAAPDDVLTIRIRGTAASDGSFCTARGITDSPPLQYLWVNPWAPYVVFNYELLPVENYSDAVIVIPSNSPDIDVDLTCTLTDLCNELTTDVIVPISIISSGD